MHKGVANITAVLNPVTRDTVRCQLPVGKPLGEALKIPDGVLISINGREDYGNPLKDGDIVTLIVAPQGGDTGKDIARTGIILAAQVAAAVATSGMSVGWQIGISAAVHVGASIGANALIPPTQPASINREREQFTRLGALTGSRNQMLPYGTVPRVYGHRRIWPPMSARPYTEINGNRQFMRLLFNLGPGPLHLSEPKIGDTVIGSFDANNQFTSNGAYEDIEIDVAEQPDLYTSQVNQIDPGVTLEEDGESAIRTTSADAEEISIDVTFPSGLFAVSSQAKTLRHWVNFRFEYREVGASGWTNAYGAVDGTARTLGSFIRQSSTQLFRASSTKRETWRGSVSWKVPSGQYEVRVTRVETMDHEPGVDEEDRKISTFDTATWSALRSVTYENPTDLPGTVQIAMRIQATDQITGILDNFSVEAKSRLAYYDGQWHEPTFNPSNGAGTGGVVTSNPAWIMADILSGSANARAISKNRIDGDSFKEWADNCQIEERFCNLIIDGQRTVMQTASLVGSTGRGSLSMRDNGIYTIIQDLEETVPVQHFTPRNSWGFTSTRSFPEVPHALRVQFVNPEADWQTDEAIVYDDGYSLDGTDCQFDDGTGVCKPATRFEVLDLEGVTSWDQAWKEGRYRLAETRLRPERYVLSADAENIACTRGDMVLVSHDVTMWGLASGRIKRIEGNTLVLDEAVTIDGGHSYNIRVRNAQGESLVKTVTSVDGERYEIEVNNTSGISAGDLFMFGEAGTETQALKVLSIEPMADLSARLTLVDAAPEIYDADQGSIPDFDSNITRPVEIDPRPPIPVITGIRSDGDSLNRGVDGNPLLRILVDYRVGEGRPTEIVEGRFRKSGDAEGWTAFGASEASSGTLALTGVERGETYIIQLRSRSGEHVSRWVQGPAHIAGEGARMAGRPEDAIGHITEDLDGIYTEIPVNLYVPVEKGLDYFIIDDRERELITITPTSDRGTGQGVLPIEEQVIEAPEGSFITLVPSQEASRSTAIVRQVAQVDNKISSATAGLAAEAWVEGQIASAKTDIFTQVENDINEATSGLALKSYVDEEIGSASASLYASVSEDVVAMINLTSDTINGARIKITGDTTFEDNVQVRGHVNASSFTAKDDDGVRMTLDAYGPSYNLGGASLTYDASWKGHVATGTAEIIDDLFSANWRGSSLLIQISCRQTSGPGVSTALIFASTRSTLSSLEWVDMTEIAHHTDGWNGLQPNIQVELPTPLNSPVLSIGNGSNVNFVAAVRVLVVSASN